VTYSTARIAKVQRFSRKFFSVKGSGSAAAGCTFEFLCCAEQLISARGESAGVLWAMPLRTPGPQRLASCHYSAEGSRTVECHVYLTPVHACQHQVGKSIHLLRSGRLGHSGDGMRGGIGLAQSVVLAHPVRILMHGRTNGVDPP